MPEFELTREYVVQTVEILSGLENIYQKTKRRKILYLRYVVYALLDRYFPHSSLSWKAQVFNQDHATVIYALKKWKEEMLMQKCYKQYVVLYLKSEFYINILLSKVTDSIKIVQEFNETNTDQKLKDAIDILIKYTLELTPQRQ